MINWILKTTCPVGIPSGVDELRLKIHPLTLGKGKKLFDNGVIPAAFALTESIVTPSGVIIASYKRAGKVKTGNVRA